MNVYIRLASDRFLGHVVLDGAVPWKTGQVNVQTRFEDRIYKFTSIPLNSHMDYFLQLSGFVTSIFSMPLLV